ncbi:hypothetical protein [Spirosoma agri]|uniref:Lipoprotein n=1 Tax=Spirosoma agri TaxID=1987381 RepID=A0A6M0IKZ6_9BACT|nr:hypothetical protein [Spirosoma agri]NEU68959.1 hypothetical protein [Spirosoma agri]
MRTILIRKVTGFVALASLTACPFVVSLASSMPSQGGMSASTKSTVEADSRIKPETERLAKNPVLARNTVAKTETASAASTAAPKTQKTHDSKTISRCWQRLMGMVREANHAHRNANK